MSPTLQNKQILRLPAVIEMTGLKRSAIYKAVAEKRFPRPVPLAPGCRARGWVAGEIAAHFERCIAERDKPRNKPKARRRRAAQ